MSKWAWFAGEIDCYTYDLACEEPTREAAIATAVRYGHLKPGERFQIVEAQSSQAKVHEGSDCVPFLRTRNFEIVTAPLAPASNREG